MPNPTRVVLGDQGLQEFTYKQIEDKKNAVEQKKVAMAENQEKDLLTRTTWILGGLFFALSLALTLLSGRVGNSNESVVDRLQVEKIDPNSLNQPATSPNVPANGIPGPLSAPTPQVRNPFTGATEQTAPATAPVTP